MPNMSKFVAGNFLLLCSMLMGSGSQILIKSLLNKYQGSLLNIADLKAFVDVPNIIASVISLMMLLLGFVFWILALSKLNLNYAYPIACTSVIFVALFSSIFLGESITLRMSIGTALILVGIIFLMPTDA